MHKMCLGKSAFREWAKAEKAVKRIASQGVRMRSYWCSLCGRFHLTRNRDNSKELKIPIPKIDPPAKPKKWNRYEQWCIDNCLKYPDLSLNDLKDKARKEIRKQDFIDTIKRDEAWKSRFGKSESSDNVI